MLIFAHRANLHGPNPQTENTLGQVQRALEAGFGLETDVRRDSNGRLYISHDQAIANSENDADGHASLWASNPDCEIALNVKELGYSRPLVEFITRHGLLDQVFLFDFELLEERAGLTAKEINGLNAGIRLASRVSDRYCETIEQAEGISPATIIWLDEFDSLWVRPEHIDRLKGLGRKIYAISPEIHGFSVNRAERRWREFQRWGIDGICTDFPLRAREIMG